MLRVGVISSHGGSNLQAIIDACGSRRIDARVTVVVSNNAGSGAITRAREHGVPGFVLNSKTHPDPDGLDIAIADVLTDHAVDVVCLAGYMKLLGARTLDRFRNHVLNVHPALLPRFGGRGMYGLRVHEAVLAAGEKTTGVTVHIADASYDHGPVVAQRPGVPVRSDDTPETLAERVLASEHVLYVETLGRIASGEIDLERIAVGATTYREQP